MHVAPLGEQLREWRSRRRMSQMDLALDTEISTRHLSFIETGRAKPSAAMIERIADCLEVPHRARNALLLAAGYAPEYRERALDGDELAAMKAIVGRAVSIDPRQPPSAVDRRCRMSCSTVCAACFSAGGVAWDASGVRSEVTSWGRSGRWG